MKNNPVKKENPSKNNPQRKRNPQDDDEYPILFSNVWRGSLKGSVQRWGKQTRENVQKKLSEFEETKKENGFSIYLREKVQEKEHFFTLKRKLRMKLLVIH